MDKALTPYVKGGGAKKYEEELKAMEKVIRKDVADACDRAKAGAPPDSIADLTNNIYLTEDGKSEPQAYIRMPDYTKSIRQ